MYIDKIDKSSPQHIFNSPLLVSKDPVGGKTFTFACPPGSYCRRDIYLCLSPSILFDASVSWRLLISAIPFHTKSINIL